MAKRTNKAGVTGRYGARYGVSVRRNAGNVLRKKNASYTCPKCSYKKVKRVSVGIWSCSKCNHTFAGGAWEPYTRATVANNRIVRRNTEGKSDTDMTQIAIQAAVDYEASLAGTSFEEGDEDGADSEE